MRILGEQLADQRLDARHARLPAHQHHFVDLRGRHVGVRHGLLARAHGTLQDVLHHLLEARPRQLHLQVLGARGVGRHKRQVDLGLEQRGKLHLGLLGGFLEPLQRHLVARQVDAVLFLELAHDPVDDALVDVVPAQVRVAVGGLHLHHALAHFQNRDVERAAAEVVHRDGLVLLLVQPIGQRRRRRLVDDAHHFQAGDLARVLGGLPLRVVEVRRDRDHRLRHLFAQVGFGRLLQLGEDHGRDLGR